VANLKRTGAISARDEHAVGTGAGQLLQLPSVPQVLPPPQSPSLWHSTQVSVDRSQSFPLPFLQSLSIKQSTHF
jgi:hypothetical protein